MDCVHIIGIYYDYGDTDPVTLCDLENRVKDDLESKYFKLGYTMQDYLDREKTTNLQRFNFCPKCGEKIDWKKIREME